MRECANGVDLSAATCDVRERPVPVAREHRGREIDGVNARTGLATTQLDRNERRPRADIEDSAEGRVALEKSSQKRALTSA
jgi:hypothetical protein